VIDDDLDRARNAPHDLARGDNILDFDQFPLVGTVSSRRPEDT